MPALTQFSLDGHVAIITLDRPDKRNALSDTLVLELEQRFLNMPSEAKAIVIQGAGKHFCAGLDLAEIKERDAVQGMSHSQLWHRVFQLIQFSRAPVVAAIHGACVGGGLELAASAHIRVADDTAFFSLPEGSRGIFVGGGGSVRIQKLLGVARMTDMMLTGRVYNSIEAERCNLAQYIVAQGSAPEKALALAKRIAQNAPLTNYALTTALPMISEMSSQQGFFAESLISSIVQSAPEAKERLRDFLEGRAEKVKASE